ncbi:hypothetical protein [Fodinicola feengrottensis]|uniref:hypothetical protein n=1 Tax=Fodinicola feengrottensis TaxID=435914 RepID=UPI0013D32DD2|nr:hypothetical protein [Fodinicola feengrottensis]
MSERDVLVRDPRFAFQVGERSGPDWLSLAATADPLVWLGSRTSPKTEAFLRAAADVLNEPDHRPVGGVATGFRVTPGGDRVTGFTGRCRSGVARGDMTD